jgi:hypothetical protein
VARVAVPYFLQGYGQIPDGYAGLEWDQYWYYADENEWPGQAHSYPMFAFNRATSINNHYFDFPVPVCFDGAWVATYNEPYHTNAVRFVCWGGEGHDILLGMTDWFSLSSEPAYLRADIAEVTRVLVEFDVAGQFLLDDMTYEESPSAVGATSWGGIKQLYR